MSAAYILRRRVFFMLVAVLGAGAVSLPLTTGWQNARAEDGVSEKTADARPVDAAGRPLPTDETQWRRKLTRQQFLVLRQKATEPAFSGRYWKSKAPGVYRCAGCDKELFTSDNKFVSECGWPSFTEPLANDLLTEQADYFGFVPRTEVVCTNCGGHLGHVFTDGPGPNGLRYCINSLSLKFEKKTSASDKP